MQVCHEIVFASSGAECAYMSPCKFVVEIQILYCVGIHKFTSQLARALNAVQAVAQVGPSNFNV